MSRATLILLTFYVRNWYPIHLLLLMASRGCMIHTTLRLEKNNRWNRFIKNIYANNNFLFTIALSCCEKDISNVKSTTEICFSLANLAYSFLACLCHAEAYGPQQTQRRFINSNPTLKTNPITIAILII